MMQSSVCTRCGGKGYYWTHKNITCYGCAGTGRDMNSRIMAMPCKVCKGKRYLYMLMREPCHCH